MTNDSDDPMWPPALWANQLQEAGEEAVEQQTQLFRQFLEASTGSGMSGGSPLGGLDQFGQLGMGAAVFKTRVQSGGRISIPDAEREALDIDEGDIVQTVVIPLTRSDQE